MLDYRKWSFLLLAGLVFLAACTKDEIIKKKVSIHEVNNENVPVYGVNDVYVNDQGVNKPNVKTTSEFISIAYSDLFGTTIDDQKLTDLSLALVAFGDKKLIEDMIIKNFLNEPGSNIPSVQDMQGDIPKFIQETYRKFYNRDPNEFETWQIEKAINEDSNLTPELIYYAFLTSNEYRYY